MNVVTRHTAQAAADARRARNPQTLHRRRNRHTPGRSNDCNAEVGGGAREVGGASCIIGLAVEIGGIAGRRVGVGGGYVGKGEIGVRRVG